MAEHKLVTRDLTLLIGVISPFRTGSGAHLESKFKHHLSQKTICSHGIPQFQNWGVSAHNVSYEIYERRIQLGGIGKGILLVYKWTLNSGGRINLKFLCSLSIDHGWSTYHWFPLIRPAIKPLFLEGGTLGGGRLTSHELNVGYFIASLS